MLCLSGFELYSRWVPLKRKQFPRGWRVAYRGFFFKGGGGGGGGGGLLTEVFFPGGLSKIEVLIKNRFSVEQAFSYFTVTGLQNKYFLRE